MFVDRVDGKCQIITLLLSNRYDGDIVVQSRRCDEYGSL